MIKNIGEITELNSLKEIGEYIENLDITICEKDIEKFQEVLENFCKIVDPKEKLSISECVEKMTEKQARQLLDELLKFSYEEESVQ